VTRSAYTPENYSLLVNYMSSYLGTPYQDQNVTLFDSEAAVQAGAGKQLTAYTIANWIPGYDFCQGSVYCDPNFSTMWWGDNLRAITLFVPQAGDVDMDLQALSYYKNAGVLRGS